MTLVHSIKDYKNAQIFVRDLDLLIVQTESAIKWYKDFARYRPVQKILYTLEEELGILKAHRSKCNKIIENKGKVLR